MSDEKKPAEHFADIKSGISGLMSTAAAKLESLLPPPPEEEPPAHGVEFVWRDRAQRAEGKLEAVSRVLEMYRNPVRGNAAAANLWTEIELILR